MTQPPSAPSTRVGTAMALRKLRVERLGDLAGWRESEDTALGRVSDEIRTVTRRLDHVQERLMSLARSIRDDMELVIEGRDETLAQANGLLGSTAQSLDALALRRSELLERLDAATDLYLVLAPTPSPSAEPVTDLTDAQRRALDAVARGQITLSRHGSRTIRTVSTDAPHIHPATADSLVNSLISRRLVVQEKNAGPRAGYQLRLTPLGSRVHAAQSGSTAPNRAAAPAKHTTPSAAARVHSAQPTGRTR
ncbi:hypothetical protein [Kitasatospora sp. NPDC001095]